MRLALSPLSLSCRRAAKPLLAAAMLALLTGCAQNGTFDLFNPLAGLLGGKPAQESSNAQPTATTIQAPASLVKDVGLFGNFEIGAGFGAQKANGMAGKVAGVTDGKPSPDSLRALGARRQTTEGTAYDIAMMGNCDGTDDSNSLWGTWGAKPAHRLKVTSPVTVRVNYRPTQIRDGNLSTLMVALYGQDVRVCHGVKRVEYYDAKYDGYFMLELLPGEYEIYTGQGYNDNAPMPYTITLTELPTISTHRSMTVSPGFTEINARGIALDRSYRNGPLVQRHELTVTEPMLVEFTAALDVDAYQQGSIGGYGAGITVSVRGENMILGSGFSPLYVVPDHISHDGNVEANRVKQLERKYRGKTGRMDNGLTFQLGDNVRKYLANMIIPLQPGQYQIFVEPMKGGLVPVPYDLNIREIKRLKMQQHLTLDQRFTQTSFEGAFARSSLLREDARFKGCGEANEYLDHSAPHKLVVTTPKMVSFTVMSLENSLFRTRLSPYKDWMDVDMAFVLRRTSGESQVFCDRKKVEVLYQNRSNVTVNAIDAFLVPGEYELYMTNTRGNYHAQYEVRISTLN